MTEAAPAKANLILHVGPAQPNGLHEVCSLFASLDLADAIEVAPAGEGDSVVCPGVLGPNLAEAALAAFRAAAPGVELPPLLVAIEKRIPVAAGLGGGSADAAAVLRAANSIAGTALDGEALRRIAAALGSDVPSQVEPRHALVTGTGDRVEPIALPPMALVLVPAEPGLEAGPVFAELDRLGGARPALDPDRMRRLAEEPLDRLAAAMENDLERAALSLRPELARTLDALREAGALAARISGSGPTAFGVFPDRAAADAAAGALPGAIVTGLREPRARREPRAGEHARGAAT